MLGFGLFYFRRFLTCKCVLCGNKEILCFHVTVMLFLRFYWYLLVRRMEVWLGNEKRLNCSFEFFRLPTNIQNSIEKGTECCLFSSDNNQWKICIDLHTISEVRLSTNQNASFQPFAKSCVLLNFVTQGWFLARSFGGKVVREIRRYNYWR